jgi:mannosyltransferase OCH1-like enzyme
MHFIWIGNNKIPNIYLEYIKSWLKNHNDWIFCFWNDENIPKLLNILVLLYANKIIRLLLVTLSDLVVVRGKQYDMLYYTPL